MKMKLEIGVILAALLGPAILMASETLETIKPLPYTAEELLSPQVRDTYSGDYLREIRFPLGGVGAGNISINGKGALSDWEVRNQPAAGFRPDFTFIGLRVADAEGKGGPGARFRVLEGWVDEDLMGKGTTHFDGGGYGMGVRYSLAAGLPRYKKSTFTGRFPFAQVALEDEAFPVTAVLEGWSPFIPGNTDDSSLPLAVLDITLHNRSDKALNAQVSFSANNFFGKSNVLSRDNEQCRMVFENTEKNEQMCFAVVGGEPTGAIASWPRSSWMGNGGYMQYINRFIRDGVLRQQLGDKPLAGSGGTSTLAVGCELQPGERRSLRYVISWYFPRRPESGGQNWYTTKFKDARDVADYFLANAERLASRTRRFQAAMFDNNLPGIITESLSSQLAVLRSCTMFRMPCGAYWGWEGTGADRGCCPGTCLHVWHYAQSMAYLFPDLERKTREWDYGHRMTPDGHMAFRAWPDAPERPEKPYDGAAADGQFGTILRVYREWQVTGDTMWLKKMWPDVKKSLEYASVAWDVDGANPFGTAQSTPPAPGDVVFDDFESADWRDWTAEGEAFQNGSCEIGKHQHPQPVGGYGGTRIADSTGPAGKWDEPQGRLISKPFAINKPYIAFLIGGGSAARQVGLRLLVGSDAVRTAAGKDSEGMLPGSWDVQELVGQTARLDIFDQSSGSWGHIMVDQIVFTDRQPQGASGPDGMMTLPQHNTLDLDLVGWNTFCGSMYQAALLAGGKMAVAAGDDEAAREYRRLFESARTLTDRHLFNGEYYQQQESVTARRQYKSGCISEQLIGQWWSSMTGLGYVYDRDHIRTSLASLFKYNFLESCREHLNASCVFNLNDDAGLLICTWPRGNRPDNDLLYADTFMVGYEDQVAANLIYEGFPLEGLAVMKAVRDRHNGRNRNPYSQLQAGNYYARSLANYSLLLAATGFRYSAVERCLWIDPKIRKDDLKTFFATVGAWGTLTLKKSPSGHRLTIDVAHGELPLKEVVVFGTQAKTVDVTVKPGATWELECGP